MSTKVAPAPRWRGPVAIVGTVLVLALAAIVLGLLELSNDGGGERLAQAPTQTPAPTPSPQPTPSPAATASPTPTPSPTTSPEASPSPGASPTTSPTPSPSPSPGGENTPTPTPSPTTSPGTGTGDVAEWPAGQSGWTVILSSDRSRATAERKARERSDPDVGVLHSNDFSSLRSGYWVVFHGQYDSRAEAERALRQLGGSSGAYVRRVVPR